MYLSADMASVLYIDPIYCDLEKKNYEILISLETQTNFLREGLRR